MSRTKPTEAEKGLLQILCNRCAAPPGCWCRAKRRKYGRPFARDLHAPRFYAAQRMGLLPSEPP